MSSEPWSKLRYFKKNERWGDPDRMNADFLYELDHFRHAVGKPFSLLAGFATDGHSDNSYHYKGRAVDGRFVDPVTRESLSISEHVLIALKAPFGGVGIYTWGTGGPFLHLDNRTATYDRKIWVSYKQGVYENLTLTSLRALLKV